MNVIKNYINKVLKCYPNKVVQCNVYNKDNMEGVKHHDFSQIVTSQMWTSRDLTINGLTIIWVYSYETLVGVILDGTIETVTHDSRHYPLTFIDFYYDLPTWARTVATRQQGAKLKRMIEEAHGSIYNYKDWLNCQVNPF